MTTVSTSASTSSANDPSSSLNSNNNQPSSSTPQINNDEQQQEKNYQRKPTRPQNEPSPEVIASLITQVSPTGQPGRQMPAARKKKKQTKQNKATSSNPQPQPDPDPTREDTQTSPVTTADQTLVDHSNQNQSESVQKPQVQRGGGNGEERESRFNNQNAHRHPQQASTRKSKSPATATTSPLRSNPTSDPNPSSQPLSPRSPSNSHSKSGSRKPSRNNPNTRNQKTQPKKSFFRFLLPCFHSTSHEEDQHHYPSTSYHRNRQSAEGEGRTEMTEADEGRSPTNLHRRLSNSIATHLKKSNRSTNGSSRKRHSDTPSRLTSQPTPVSDTTTPAGAAMATSLANAHGSGVELPIDETEGVLSGAVVPPGRDASPSKKKSPPKQSDGELESDDSSREDDQDQSEEEDEEEDRIVAMGGMGIPIGEDGSPQPLLCALDSAHAGRKCLVLDLDETLVHSSFKIIPNSDFVVPVEIENSVHKVYVIKRPGVDEFMRRMGEIYEVVVFTASLSKYADPVLDMLDIHRVVRHRLFRESCYNHKGNYVKDLSQLGRPIGETIIIDNSPASYIFHPNNAVPVSSWFNDPHDTELTDLAAFLTDIANVPDVRGILDPRLS